MTVYATAPALARSRLDVGLTFKGAWNAFTAEIVALIVGALIACILSIVTIGVLAGPLAAGLYSMAVGRIRDGRPPGSATCSPAWIASGPSCGRGSYWSC